MFALKYNHLLIEGKWQKYWEKNKCYSPDLKGSENKFYNLWMFPYPSAEGLHAGHAFASTGSDIYGRFMRMRGKTVFQPIGYDSFGIHSENYAIKIKEDPHEVVKRTTKHYEEQMRALGHGYDWSRTVTTSDIDYYKWTQWLFLKMFEAGLAYKKTAPVNFCPSCKTVLADEQVITGACERCKTGVVQKELEQWFFRITKYADRLLTNLKKIDWSKKVLIAQANWIGRSEGRLIDFKGEDGKLITVFTTRPDTLNAVTFLATSDLYEEGSVEKKGEFTGKYALNPLNNRRIPIWKTNYVAPDYGTGVVMGVPAHDERDREFAEKYGLEKLDIQPQNNQIGKKYVNYHLRDWLVSRQRYWGVPIPMINCGSCGWVPVPEEKLPVALPSISDYEPEGTGRGPLANHPEYYQVDCPKCGRKAQRETDVMDTFVDSSWYFLRYPSVKSEKASLLPFDPAITKKWLPVDLYFGGAEHSVLHLMYARFITMVLHDLGYLDFEEPFPKFFAHGLMIKDGAKMSKSRGNVVNPDEYIAKYGADTLRLYLMFLGPMDGFPDFRDTGIEGMRRFVEKLWRLFNYPNEDKQNLSLDIKMNQTIQKVTSEIDNFRYNTAIAALMEYVNALFEAKIFNRKYLKPLILMLAPFIPHLAEEVWQEIFKEKGSVHFVPWPKYDPNLTTEAKVTVVIQINGKLKGEVKVSSQVSHDKEKIISLAKENQKIQNLLKGSKIKKEVFVDGKLVNFVT